MTRKELKEWIFSWATDVKGAPLDSDMEDLINTVMAETSDENEKDLDRAVQQMTAYHQACDILMAMLIDITGRTDKPFYPSQSIVWPTIVAGNNLTKELKGKGHG